MSTPRHVIAAVIAAAGYLTVAVITLIKPQPDGHWGAAGQALEAAFVVGLIGSAVAMTGLRAHISSRSLGVRAAQLARLGFLGMAVAAVASLTQSRDTLGPVFLLSVLATVVGLLLLGVAGLRESAVPRWVPVVPFATMLVGMAFADQGGCAVIAAGWATMAVVMNSAAFRVRSAPAIG